MSRIVARRRAVRRACLRLLVVVALHFGPFAAPGVALGSGYDSSYAGESAFVELGPGQTNEFQVFFANTGTITWTRGSATQVDEADRIVETDLDGGLIREYPLPEGMGSEEILRLALDPSGQVVIWATGYHELPLDALPPSIDLRSLTEAKERSGRGILSPIGLRYIGELNGPTAGRLVTRDGSRVTEFAARGYFGSARPIGFDRTGHLYFVVEDLFETGPIRVEASIRRYSPAGQMTGAARLPVDDYVVSPRRAIDVTADAVVHVMVPARDGLNITA
ncbi:MAG: hypothetical protein ACRDM0_13935 [Thermoleophilaceae bacterium]